MYWCIYAWMCAGMEVCSHPLGLGGYLWVSMNSRNDHSKSDSSMYIWVPDYGTWNLFFNIPSWCIYFIYIYIYIYTHTHTRRCATLLCWLCVFSLHAARASSSCRPPVCPSHGSDLTTWGRSSETTSRHRRCETGNFGSYPFLNVDLTRGQLKQPQTQQKTGFFSSCT